MDRKGHFCLLKPGRLQSIGSQRLEGKTDSKPALAVQCGEGDGEGREGPWGQRDGLLTYLWGHRSVVISHGFCNKRSHMEWLKTTESHSLAVREARSRNSVLGGPYSLPELPVSVHPSSRGSGHPRFCGWISPISVCRVTFLPPLCVYTIRKRDCIWASQVALVVKNPAASAGDIRDTGSISGSERSPGGGHGSPLQYSGLENPHGQRSLVGYSP